MKSNPLVKINELIEQDYLIVVDTNVLLGLYRLSPDYADFALKCLEKIKSFIRIPYVVALEFSRHNRKLYKDRQLSIKNSISDNLTMIENHKKKVLNAIAVLEKRNFPEIDELLNSVGACYDKATSLLDDYFDEHSVLTLINDTWNSDLPEDFLDELQIKAPMVSYSGGLILDENQKVIYSKGFSVEMAKRLYEYIKYYYQIPVNFYVENHWMVDEIDEGIEEESIITGLKPEKLDLNGIKKVHKLLVIAESGIVDRLEMSLKEKFSGLKIYKSKDTYLEIMDESVSKSSAIQFLCDKMKIGLHQTVSFGDNYNDLDMLLLTGKGFAMANGAQGVLESIPTHTLSNDEDGIVYALDNLVGE